MSAERLRQAAAEMRERAETATSGPWEFRPRRGFESMRDNPATIGFVDTAGYFVMLREGTWATEGDMGFIASWHPAVALAVADWLDGVALFVEAKDDEEYFDLDGDPIAPEDTHAIGSALAVADAYLGGTP